MTPAVPQARCTLQRISIDISLSSCNPNLFYFLPLLNIISCHTAFPPSQFKIQVKENHDYNKGEKRISFFSWLASQLDCLLRLNSIYWPSVSCLQQNSKGDIWTHPPLQPADQAKEIIDTFMFTLNHTGKLHFSIIAPSLQHKHFSE